MKNIERPEVIRAFAKFFRDNDICSYDFSNENDCDKCALLPICDEEITYEKLFQWLNSEYIEPHHWEPWELEAMRNIPKRIVYLERRHDTSLPRALQKEDCYSDHGICTQINFPSLKNEKINIDAELERNGMNRES